MGGDLWGREQANGQTRSSVAYLPYKLSCQLELSPLCTLSGKRSPRYHAGRSMVGLGYEVTNRKSTLVDSIPV
jgi:hypothetical protein